MSATTEKYAAWLDQQKTADADSWRCELSFDGPRPANLPEVRSRTTKQRGIVTVEDCRAIIAAVQEHCPGSKISRLTIDMTDWDWSGVTVDDVPSIWYGDIPGPRKGLDKKAVYDPATNTLRIWQDDLPIYENRNGVVCRDRDALADCLC